MHIIFTSFLGVFLIKCINLIASPVLIFGKFTEINDDIFNLVDDTTNFSWFKLSILFVFVIYFLLKVTKEESISENY